MSTRSAIGYKLPTGEVRGIYCHWDGYVSNNGKILVESYTDQSMVWQLVEFGDLSSLSSDINERVYYGRDIGETEVGAKTFTDVDDFVTTLAMSNCEYFYLWNGNEWIVTNGNLEFDRVEDLLALEIA